MKQTMGRICIFVLALGIARELLAETPVILTLGTVTAAAGSEVSVPLTFTASPDDGCSGFQFDLTLPPSVTYTSTTIGPVLTAASKQISDNPAIPRVLVIGLTNATTINSGLAGTVNLQIAPTATAGTYSIPLINLFATDPTGSAVPITGVNANLTITTPAPSITSGQTVSGIAGTPFASYQIAATNNPSSFGATALAPGLTVNPTTGLITGTPTQAGTFDATMSATNGFGTGTSPLYITIAMGGPVASFSRTPLSGNAPLVVTFNGSFSTDNVGTIVSWDWNFGDGATDTTSGAMVTHTYAAVGTYVSTIWETRP
jgi:hypothetical protein